MEHTTFLGKKMDDEQRNIAQQLEKRRALRRGQSQTRLWDMLDWRKRKSMHCAQICPLALRPLVFIGCPSWQGDHRSLTFFSFAGVAVCNSRM
ncbi:hypothetical protein I7I50_09514 [Histoplasma capsulatum G186AR]|uniref:Uncharacterized protein n=1 Tax=Ajellomyces capsulatus TaxID=5037 RepID=A0A8H7YSI2_AJECA|nr:hypothetical protein I7I52_07035 [Histoplasma capsulatum]QSS74379.1 hypothetical protein I7I50_09514 [Histoplasma capsulatum G186AR]